MVIYQDPAAVNHRYKRDNSFSKALIFLLSLHTLSAESRLHLMPLPMNLSHKCLCGAKNALAVLRCSLQVVFFRMLKRKFATALSPGPPPCFLTTTQVPTCYSRCWPDIGVLFHLTWWNRPGVLVHPTAFFLRYNLGTYSPSLESYWMGGSTFLLKTNGLCTPYNTDVIV